MEAITVAECISCVSKSGTLLKVTTPSFGYHVDRIVRVNEGSTEIGAFIASDLEGDEISYSISNIDMDIAQDGTLFDWVLSPHETNKINTNAIAE